MNQGEDNSERDFQSKHKTTWNGKWKMEKGSGERYING